MTIKQAIIEPYGWVLNIALGLEAATKWRVKHWDDDDDQGAAVGYMDYNEDAVFEKRWLMALPEHFCQDVVQHEALHCAVMMMEESGQEPNYETQEGLAYSQQHIVREVLKKCYPAEYKRVVQGLSKARGARKKKQVQ